MGAFRLLMRIEDWHWTQTEIADFAFTQAHLRYVGDGALGDGYTQFIEANEQQRGNDRAALQLTDGLCAIQLVRSRGGRSLNHAPSFLQQSPN